MKASHKVAWCPDEITADYLKQIHKYPLLTPKEETDLGRILDTTKRESEGYQHAFTRLVEGNLRLVVYIAKKYHSKYLTLADLIGHGNEGLVEAVYRYDYRKGTKFVSFAALWIKQKIIEGIKDASLIRLPDNRLCQQQNISKLWEELVQKNQRMPTYNDMPSSISKQDYEIFLNQDYYRNGISNTKSYPKKSKNLEQCIETQEKYSPDRLFEITNLKDQIMDALRNLSIREQSAIEYKYGLEGKPLLSLREIGARLHKTKERARQIEKSAEKTLRDKYALQQLFILYHIDR